MQCSDIEAVLENEGLSPLPEEVRAHAASCSACSNLIADFSAILSVAETLPREVEPPNRVWVAVRNQLEGEGIIKLPTDVPVGAKPSWWKNFGGVLHGRVIASALGLAIVAVFVVQIERARVQPRDLAAKTSSDVANHEPVSPAPASTVDEALGKTDQTLGQVERTVPIVEQADFSNQDRVDVSLRQNLKSLNQFIAECRRRLKEDPNDELAREYLSVAYQQKAELLSAMLDRGRSVN